MLEALTDKIPGLGSSQQEDDSQFTADGEASSTPDNSANAGQGQVYLPIKSENSLILVIGGLALVTLLSVLGNLLLLFNNRSLANRRSTYVQQSDGTTFKASEFDRTYREPEVIRNTAVRWMQMSFEWDNQIPGSGREDTGYAIQGSTQEIPTEVYLASYLMEPGFRTEFLRLMSDRIGPDVMNGSKKTVLRVFSVSNPRRVGEALWEVDIVATRIERDDRQETAEVNMNRTITLKAIPPIEPLFEGIEPSAWRQKTYSLLSNGLVITRVEPLETN